VCVVGAGPPDLAHLAEGLEGDLWRGFGRALAGARVRSDLPTDEPSLHLPGLHRMSAPTHHALVVNGLAPQRRSKRAPASQAS
jgi:hypothetical protein